MKTIPLLVVAVLALAVLSPTASADGHYGCDPDSGPFNHCYWNCDVDSPCETAVETGADLWRFITDIIPL